MQVSVSCFRVETEQGVKSTQSQQYSYQNDVNDIVLMSLLMTLNRFAPFSMVYIVNLEQVNACWDDIDNNIMVTIAMMKMLVELTLQ